MAETDPAALRRAHYALTVAASRYRSVQASFARSALDLVRAVLQASEHGMTVREIAQVAGLSSSRVGQMLQQARQARRLGVAIDGD